jgi:hypothetical protein
MPEAISCLRPSARASDNIQSGYLIDWYFKISCEMLLFMKLYNKKRLEAFMTVKAVIDLPKDLYQTLSSHGLSKEMEVVKFLVETV